MNQIFFILNHMKNLFFLGGLGGPQAARRGAQVAQSGSPLAQSGARLAHSGSPGRAKTARKLHFQR